MRLIYSVLFYLAMPFIWLRLRLRARRNPAYAKRFRERLGYINATAPNGVWWHAVSVGEVLASIPLINAFLKRFPAVPIIVTTMTPTGFMQAQKSLGDSVTHVYAPYDLPCAVARFLRQAKPGLLVIMETELWPNIIAQCHQLHIPVILTNARLSEKSARGYARFRTLTQEMLKNITLVAAQNPADAERFLALGLSPQQLVITGTVKFDMTISSDIQQKALLLRQQWDPRRPVFIAASTHAGEEDIILKAMQQILACIPNALLLLVPRHPDRVKEVLNLCHETKLSTCLRTQKAIPKPNDKVFLIDTMGELLLFYAAADVAFVGGSLIPKGGHNVLEPAALALSIITGPSMYNFADIERLLLEARALIKVSDTVTLAKQVIAFLNDEKARKAIGQRAQSIINKNRGATEKQLDLIAKIWTMKKFGKI